MYGRNSLSAESNAKTFKLILLTARMITFHIYVQCSLMKFNSKYDQYNVIKYNTNVLKVKTIYFFHSSHMYSLSFYLPFSHCLFLTLSLQSFHGKLKK